MNRIRLETKMTVVDIKSPFRSSNRDASEPVYDNIYEFERGKIYGIVCEPRQSGDALSCFMSNQIPWEDEKMYFDEVQVKPSDIGEISWYMGRPLYCKGIMKREISVKKALNQAISRYHRYENINDIISEFNLQTMNLDYGLSKYGYERWRASLAIGYANCKIVYCFPWLNTSRFYNWIINSSVYCFFRKLRSEGNILILPTIRRANVEGFVDEIIEIHNPDTNSSIINNKYFQDYY